MKVDHYIPPPGDPLRPYVDSIWSVHATGDYSRELILPKGNVDILFNLSDTFLFGPQHTSHETNMACAAYLAGVHTGPLANHPQGEARLVGISLKMESAASVIPMPLREVTDLVIDADQVFHGIGELHARIQEASDFERQCEMMRSWLAARVRTEPRTEQIGRACGYLGASPTDARLNRVAADVGISGRHLRRLFLDHVGVGPAHYLRLARFTRALYLMSGPASLTEIAMEAHYFDQAHFCHDFKTIAGMTPGEYRDRASHVPGHVFEEIENYEV
jgi:AraC-like DNA-binding protein